MGLAIARLQQRDRGSMGCLRERCCVDTSGGAGGGRGVSLGRANSLS